MKNFNQNEEIVNSQDEPKNNKFEELLKNMEDLQETEEGKLKGGFVVFNGDQENNGDANNDGDTHAHTICGFNCPCKKP